MKIPSLNDANKLLAEAESLNPGPWIKHSRYAAEAAENISARCKGMDPEASYIFGLLHDIGRREGVHQMRHSIDGYNYLMSLGFDDSARICLTHSFTLKNMDAVFGDWDCSDEEYKFIKEYIKRNKFDDYDLLLQLCDALALPSGFCLVEKRMVDTALRYGTKPLTTEKWKSCIRIKEYFEKKIGCSVYTLLPGVVSNTFGVSIEELKG